MNFEPDYAVTLGESIVEMMIFNGVTQEDIATRTGISLTTIKAVVDGRYHITPMIATSLANVLGVSARFWLSLDETYEDAISRLGQTRPHKGPPEWLDKVILWFIEKFPDPETRECEISAIKEIYDRAVEAREMI